MKPGTAILALALALQGSTAEAGPHRLRADALVQAQAPFGALVLEGGAEEGALGVEVFVFGDAGGDPSPEGDVLVAALRYRDPLGRGELRAGRLVLGTGALFPVHMDGVVGLGRTPWRSSLELFLGVPVTPRFRDRAFDWLAGGRIAQSFALGTAGLAYAQRRDARQLVDQEIGLDVALFSGHGLDGAARVAYDLMTPGLSEARLAMAYALGDLRFDLAGAQRSAGRILPATSLFTVLGDYAYRSATAGVSWRAAPRLDLRLSGGARFVDGHAYDDLNALAALRLGPTPSAGSVGIELRRQGAPEGGWTGVRIFSRVPILEAVALSGEAELVRPDSDVRGALWPWGLLAVSWRLATHWELAVASEASATREARLSVDALARLTYLWSDG